MKRKTRQNFFILIILIFAVFVSLFFGERLAFSIQKAFAQNLITVTSILFGVLGIWVGLMEPEAIRVIYSSDKDMKKKQQKWEELGFLFKPIFISLGIFAFSSTFILLGEILKLVPIFTRYRLVFRMLGTFTILLLFVGTLYLFMLSIRPGAKLLTNCWLKIRADERRDCYRPVQNFEDKEARNI